jgi:hypothetical protein
LRHCDCVVWMCMYARVEVVVVVTVDGGVGQDGGVFLVPPKCEPSL